MHGFDIFMKVAKRLCARRSDVVVAVVGEDRVCYGSDERFTGGKSFKEWVLSQDDYDLSRIRFVGRMPPGALARLLAASDLHLYLATQFVLSWSLLNAMACGAPVLASDIAPVREVLRDGETGLLAPGLRHRPLVRASERSAGRPSAHRPLGKAASALIRDRYSVEACLPRMLKLYRSVARRSRQVHDDSFALSGVAVG